MEQLTFSLPPCCGCGCGTPVPPARHTDKRSGLVEGKPARYIKGHSRRLRIDEGGRQCGECGAYKQWDDFHLSRTTAYGHVTTCKPCKSLKAAINARPRRREPNTDGVLCECGCGRPTNLASRTEPGLGLIKGKPVRFIRGHQRRGKVFTDPEQRRRNEAAKSRRHYQAHREERLAAGRAYRAAGYKRPPGGNLRANYGITYQRYSQMVTAQCGACAICGIVPGGDPGTYSKMTKLVVDHDHETGRVRALLCTQCNLMLGHGGDDARRLRSGANYLSEWEDVDDARQA